MSIDDTADGLQPVTCPNCRQAPGNGTFCPSCGQKNERPKLRLRSVLGEFFSVVFNFDNLFFRTLKGGLYPSRLANTYIRGARKKYLNPFRFFFYAWLAYALVSQGGIISQEGGLVQVDFGIQKNEHSSFIESLMKNDVDADSADVLEPETFKIYARPGYVITLVLDSMELRPATDSSKTILLSDLRSLTRDSLHQKYKISHWREKFALGRTKQIDKGPEFIFQFLSDHVIWLIFGIIPFSALWLKWLFWRSERFYVEHVIYLLYLFAMFFGCLILITLAKKLPDSFSFVAVLVAIGIFLYSYLSLKNFSQKGYVRTFFIWLVYLIGNFFLFLLLSTVYLAISIAIF